MFEVPTKQYNLMAEYTELVISGLKRKYRVFSLDQIEQNLLNELSPINNEYIENMDVDYELNSFDNFESFIEDRIGVDFVVLDDFQDYAFCIYEVDDFITETERLKNVKSSSKQQITIKELNENKLAA